jgi:hypothetical protein
MADEITPPPKPKATRGATKTPDEWARELGLIIKTRADWQQEGFAAEHAGAAMLHGWREHAHHAGAPMQLTLEDYKAALKAINTSPAKPHPAALSKHCNHNFGGHSK